MFALCLSLFALGLAAVDPIGIGAMPILLLHKNPYRRSFLFLAGSFASLFVMGVAFARGLGNPILHFQQSHSWFTPSVEAAAGTILFIIAGAVFWQRKHRKNSPSLSPKTLKWLEYSGWRLFGFGASLVAVQSVIDVVFVIAMVRAGQLGLSNLSLGVAVALYAVAALALQLLVIATYALASEKHQARLATTVQAAVTNYGEQLVVVVSIILGGILISLAV